MMMKTQHFHSRKPACKHESWQPSNAYSRYAFIRILNSRLLATFQLLLFPTIEQSDSLSSFTMFVEIISPALKKHFQNEMSKGFAMKLPPNWLEDCLFMLGYWLINYPTNHPRVIICTFIKAGGKLKFDSMWSDCKPDIRTSSKI